ncbi:HSP40/DnaJ peptide-binding, partial [Sesbania bispinosa]
DFCMSCGGSGVVEGIKEVKVTIPAGVDSGDTIHVPEAGNAAGSGGRPGSLYIKIKAKFQFFFSVQIFNLDHKLGCAHVLPMNESVASPKLCIIKRK